MRPTPLRAVVLGLLSMAYATGLPAAEVRSSAPASAVVGSMPAEARATLEEKAAAGMAEAQLELGLAYEEGATGKKDPVKAAYWYRRAADLNLGMAHLRLGLLAEAGTGVTQSYTEARERYERAMSLGVVEANLRLGVLYIEGWGVPRDSTIAVSLIEKAAESGYRPAQTILSDMYAAGIGAKRDIEKAISWAQRAAQGKDPGAQIRLGTIAFGGVGVKQDVQLAREWFQLSAAQEYSDGMLAMAATFLRKKDVTPEDLKLGKQWLELAIENGNSAAAFYLAAMLVFEAKQDVLPTEVEQRVRELLTQSAQAGEIAADEVLERVKWGSTFLQTFTQVMSVPFGTRYMQRYDKAREAALRNPTADRQPIPTRMVVPVYPAALRVTGKQGEVLVDFIVDTTGRVRNAFVVRTSHEAFSSHALVAVNQWTFMPAVKNGALVNTHMQVPVYFSLSQVRDGPARRAEGATAPVVEPAKK